MPEYINHLDPELMRIEISALLGRGVAVEVKGIPEKQHVIFTREDDILKVSYSHSLFNTEYVVLSQTGIFLHPRIERILLRGRDRLFESRL